MGLPRLVFMGSVLLHGTKPPETSLRCHVESPNFLLCQFETIVSDPGGIEAPGPEMLGPGGTDSPHFFKAQDCLWNSEEQ